MIKIIDIIKHRNKYGIQTFLVLDRKPEYVYERVGDFLIAEQDGFFNFFTYKKDRFADAFAGRSFELPLKNGSFEKCNGQWWDSMPPDYSDLVDSYGIGTPEGLNKCNVFAKAYVDPCLVSDWLESNEPTNNYNKYCKESEFEGVHRIVSKWDEAKQKE